MARQRGTVGAGALLGLLVLAVTGRADEAAAVKAIEKLGGRVRVDDRQPGAPVVVGVDFHFTEVTDAGLKELKKLKSLQSLDLTDTKITDAGLKELKELKSLQSLDLTDTKITDAGLKELKELKSLQELDLSGTKVTDAGLKELKELKSLQRLNLFGTSVTDAGLKELKELKHLQWLVLGPVAVTDGALRTLREIGLLHVLAEATAKGEKRPSSSADVTSVDLNYTKVTGAGLKELKEFKNLQELCLGFTAITDADLKGQPFQGHLLLRSAMSRAVETCSPFL